MLESCRDNASEASTFFFREAIHLPRPMPVADGMGVFGDGTTLEDFIVLAVPAADEA